MYTLQGVTQSIISTSMSGLYEINGLEADRKGFMTYPHNRGENLLRRLRNVNLNYSCKSYLPKQYECSDNIIDIQTIGLYGLFLKNFTFFGIGMNWKSHS